MFSEMIMDRVKDNPLVKKYIKGEFTEKIYFLNAEGGYGKSTSLKAFYYYLVEQGAQANNHIVPILVDVKSLTEFGEKGSAGNMPKPIEKYIIKNYCGAESDPNESLLEKVVNLFSKNNAPKFANQYTYFIFVDAINEVNDELKSIILDEMKQMSESDSVKFFISSRVNESSLPDGTVKYKLLPLDEEKIRVYLDNNFGKTGEKVDLSKINDSLVDILRVPMYLSVFRETYDEKTPYPDIYEAKTVRKSDILDSFIQKLLDDNKGKERSVDKAVIEFVVKYFLPALAFKMYNSNLSMQFSDRDFRKLRNDFDYFDSILVPDEYLTAFKANNIGIKSVCLNFGIVTFVNGYYAFTHQNWRDLFIAKHIINCMNAEKLDELETPVSDNVRQFVGELIREHKDGCGYLKDYMDKSDAEKARKSECDYEEKDNLEVSASPIEDFLQKHNLKCQSPLSAIATKNLIDIMKTSRNGNITVKYDNLDLKYVYFYNSSMPKSTFSGTKLYNYNFIPQGHTDNVKCVSFSPDGKKIVSGSRDESIRIWDIGTGLQIGKISTRYPVETVAFSPDGKKIVSAGWEDAIHILNAETGDPIGDPLFGHTGYITSVAFSPDGTKIVSGSYDKTVRIFDVKTGLQIGEPFTGHTALVDSVAFSPDGTKIVSGSSDETIRIWDTETGEQIGEPLTGHTGIVNSVSFSPDGKKIVSGSDNETVRIWDTETGEQMGEPLTGHTSVVTSVSFSPDGKKIVSGSTDKTIRIWDAKTGELIGDPVAGHTDYVTSVAFSPDGTKIVSGSNDKTVRVWDVETGSQIGEPLGGSTSSVRSVSFSPDGTKIVSGSDDKTIRMWNVETGSQMGKPLTGHTRIICSASFSPDGTKILSGSYDKSIRVWDTDTGIQMCKISTADLVKSVSFSPDGKKIVSTGWESAVHIWDTVTGKQICELSTPEANLSESVSFSPDGKKIIESGNLEPIRIWNAETFKLVGILDNGGTVAVFSPDGKRIATGFYDIKVLDAETCNPVSEDLQGNKTPVQSLAFSPDAKKIVSGSVDGTVRMWDVETGIYIGKLNMNSNTDCEEDDVPRPYIPNIVPRETVRVEEKDLISSIVFSPDGRKIVCGSFDGTIKILDLENRLCTIIYNNVQSYIGNCDFRNAEFNGEDESEFYGMIYSNGGLVKDKFVPKPVPFEFSDESKGKEEKNMNNMQGDTFTVINDSGEEIKCEILFTYENEKTGVNYIAYTDNTTDEDGNTKVYASVFDPEQENPELLPIETEEEWKLINGVLESLTDSDEE